MTRFLLKAVAQKAIATIAILFICLSAAAKTYTVKYVGLPSGTTGGFTIKSTAPFATGSTYKYRGTNYSVYNAISSTDNSSDLSVDDYYYPGSGNTVYPINGDNYCISITADNYSTYITPNTVSGYNLSGVSVDETNLVITITYANSKLITWSDGTFTYSNYHIQSTSNQGYMDETFDYYPDKPEVAISLNLGEPQSITDDIAYQMYFISSSNKVDASGVPTGTGNWYTLGSDGYYNSSDTRYPTNGNGVILEATSSNNYTVTATDDDGDGQATYVLQSSNFTYQGTTTNGYYIFRRDYVFKRTHDVAISTVTDVTIPKTVDHDGKTYYVTAIQKWGFAYGKSDMNVYKRCNANENYDATIGGTKGKDKENHFTDYPGTDTYDNINDHSNDYLQTVRFEDMSNVHSIGDYAFMSCKKLTSIVIPASVTYFGSGLFECDKALNDCRFQTLTDSYVSYLNDLETDASTKDEATVPVTTDLIGQVRWHTLRNFTFWFCTGMKSLELPDGITEIKGTSFGASMQYMTSLINLRLPNTLTTIGPHFLCSAISIETLTIPASVTYIDGACFHGCENLTSVYLLGPAATLKATTSAGETFGENSPFCAEHVNNCTFYTTDDYLSGYQNDATWSTINNNGTWDPANGEYANYLKVMPAETRTFPMKWVTALFPKKVENYTSVFGEGTKVAIMESATKTTGTDPSQNNKPITIYDITFKLIEGADIPANTPVMIKAGKQTDYKLYQLSDEQDETWKKESTRDHAYTVTVDEDGTEISMKGRYLKWMLTPWDYYFMYKDKVVASDGTITYPDDPARFYRVADQAEAPYVGPCRCYWTVAENGIKTNALTTAKQGFFTSEATGITAPENVRINVSGIYDLNGRKLDIPADQLPQGLYIVNGKKIVKK